MKERSVGDGAFCSLVKGNGRSIGVHRRRIPEPLPVRIRAVDRLRPAASPRSRAGVDCHRRARPSRPLAGQIEQAEWRDGNEADQPRCTTRHLDVPGLLKDLRETREGTCCGIEDGSLLDVWRRKVVIEAGVDRSKGAKRVPLGRMISSAKVDPPEFRPRRELVPGRSHRREQLRVRRLREFRHRRRRYPRDRPRERDPCRVGAR